MSHLRLPCGPPAPPQRDRLLASNGSSSASAATPATSPPNQAPQRRTHNPYDPAWLPWSVYGSRYTDVVRRPAPPVLSSQHSAAAKTPTPSQMTHDAVQMTQELLMIPHSVTGLLTEGARLVEASLLPTQPLDSPNPLRTDGARTTSRCYRPTPAAAPLHRRLVSVTNIYYGAFDGDLWKVAAFLNGLVNTVVCPAAAPTSPFLIRFSPQRSSHAPSADSHIYQFQVEVYAREPSTASTASTRNSVFEGAMNVASVNDAKSFTDQVLNYYGRHVRVIFDHGDVLWIHDNGRVGDNASLRAIDQYVGSLRSIVDHKTRHARMQGLPPATMGIKPYFPQRGDSSTLRKLNTPVHLI